ncbi:DUF4345 family protein [Pseudomarimonas salicorniae]|uniref:DUF4345 domain-containing protein n=1 Tax=Pseudomarimonas salicorniae TaxID=2933270 RepID=A0ABT0GIK4_9GAMM|nr:DUF4345 family protein [Lysobacter sp. CAU 1642]MCK7594383.1 DUF4345 domain-containing protein [Lysobacter sp. CAU 1642]
MRARLERTLLWVAGLGFVGFGLAFLVAPLRTLAEAGIEIEGALAAVELRAFYGGLELGLGSLLLAAALREEYRRAGLWLCLASYGAIGLTRAAGMWVEGVSTPFLWFAVAVEIGLGAGAALALRSNQAMR